MQTVLVVDDCVDVAWILGRHLRDAGFRVCVAADGARALEMVRREPPDCIMLDLMMPGMSGVQVMQALRSDVRTQAVPVVIVSARVGEGKTHVSTENDADFCVPKPFTRLQIVNAVRSAIRQRQAA